ncbi:hypothetical protein [Thermoactinomyces sp. DSM 45892]|uniref:hypothetical protein n=1 Tax=Thermoactinomyces sp. DSM 45892 TaxID=1882753 RepID=UPI00089C5036|nr:hypothetical protein [Thermoactinomyces sp. DSM 45892]SDZ16939.1 hypothetical protein SAMN05444416_11532 [Thermoactinomyces sp. DSM 45892]
MDILKKHGSKLIAGSYLGFLTFGVLTLIVSLILFGILGTIFYQAFDISQLDFSNSNPDMETIYKLADSIGYAVIIMIPLMILIYFASMALLTAGMTGAVNDAVYHDRSSVSGFLTHGFKKFWKVTKLFLAYLIVLYIPIILVEIFISAISNHSPALEILLLIPFYIVTIPFHISMAHGTILCLQKDLRVWAAVKAGFQTLTRAFGQTFLSGILLLVLSIALMIGFGILFVLGSVMIGTSSEPNPLFIVMMGLVIGVIALIISPPVSIIYQLILTKRFKEIIEPRVFGYDSTTEQQGSDSDVDPNSDVEQSDEK